MTSISFQSPTQIPDDDDDDDDDVEDGEPDDEEIAPSPASSSPPPTASQQAPQPVIVSQAVTQPASAAAAPAQPAVQAAQAPCPDGVQPPAPQRITFEVIAIGASEVLPVANVGSAFARFTIDEASRELTYFVTVSGLSPNLVTAAHIHRGAPGVNGPIIQFISAVGFTQAVGTILLTQTDLDDLKAGNLYLNIHSIEYPGGFARGQLMAGVTTTSEVSAQAPCIPAAPPAAVSQPPVRVSPPAAGDAGLAGTWERIPAAATSLAVFAVMLCFSTMMVVAKRR